MTYETIIARLEKATAPDRQLDAAIAVACKSTTGFVEHLRDEWVSKASPNSGVVPAPKYTSSIDAALTLVPEGMFWHVACGKSRPDEPLGGAQIITPGPLDAIGEGEAATPVIALCIAALKARGVHGESPPNGEKK